MPVREAIRRVGKTVGLAQRFPFPMNLICQNVGATLARADAIERSLQRGRGVERLRFESRFLVLKLGFERRQFFQIEGALLLGELCLQGAFKLADFLIERGSGVGQDGESCLRGRGLIERFWFEEANRRALLREFDADFFRFGRHLGAARFGLGYLGRQLGRREGFGLRGWGALNVV